MREGHFNCSMKGENLFSLCGDVKVKNTVSPINFGAQVSRSITGASY